MNPYRWLWPYVRPYRWRLLLGFAIVVVTSLMALINPYLTGQLVEQVIVARHLEKLYLLIIVMFSVTIFRMSVRYGMVMIFESVSQNVVLNIRMKVYERLQAFDFPFFDTTKTGDIMARMTSDMDFVRHFVSWVDYNTFEQACVFTFSLLFLGVVNFYYTLCLLALTPLIGFFAVKLAIDVKPTFAALREQFSRVNSAAQENIAGHRVVRAFTREAHETEKFLKENAEYKRKALDSAGVWAKYIPVLETLSSSMMVIQLFVGGVFVIKEWLTLGDYFIFNSLIWALNNPLRMAGWLVNDIERFQASAEKIIAMYDTPYTIKNPVHPVKLDAIQGNVEFRNVTFSYGDEPVLNNISFSVTPGMKVGIIGPTGSGKTSLARLICRFYDCQQGSVLIDGVDVRQFDVQFLRSNVGIAMQDVFLHSDTIEGNIAFGIPAAPMEDVIEAAKLANVESFVHDLEQGYDTIIGERGVGLSGGQKQRVALARLLLKNPPIMILDDTTSSVDVETERHIFESLKTYTHRKTMFVIAHRVVSVMDADVIFVLQNGQIIEQGTHHELLARNGYYHTLWQHQRSTGIHGVSNVEHHPMAHGTRNKQFNAKGASAARDANA